MLDNFSDGVPESSSCSTVISSENVGTTATQIPGNFNFSNQCWYIQFFLLLFYF